MAYIDMACRVMAHIVMAYIVMACIVMAYKVMAYIHMACIVMTWKKSTRSLLLRDNGVASLATSAERVFFIISEHADGERRRPVSMRRYLKTRLAETFQVLPSPSI